MPDEANCSQGEPAYRRYTAQSSCPRWCVRAMYRKARRRPMVVLSEVKTGQCSLNGPWTDPERHNMQKVLAPVDSTNRPSRGDCPGPQRSWRVARRDLSHPYRLFRQSAQLRTGEKPSIGSAVDLASRNPAFRLPGEANAPSMGRGRSTAVCSGWAGGQRR